MVSPTAKKKKESGPTGNQWNLLQSRRKTLAALLTRGGSERLPEAGTYRWTCVMFDLVAQRPREVVDALEANVGMTRLAHALKGKSGRERSPAIVEAARHLAGPGTCELDAHTGSVRWMRSLTVEGRPVTEVDFFLGFDLLDREVARA